MAKKRVAIEIGMGTSLRRADYTAAAVRALKDALWHNSLNMAPAFGFPKEAMIVEVEIGVQEPGEVDTTEVAKCLPYGQSSVAVSLGGLDIPKPDGGKTVMANATAVVYFDMERVA